MEEKICAGTRKGDGLPCVVRATAGSDYCWHHDPDRSKDRQQAASTAGKAGGRGRGAMSKAEQVERIRHDARAVAGSILDGKVSSRAGDTICRALSLELKAVETYQRVVADEDFDKRLTELEDEILG